jgi:hypothetical protein
MFVATTSVTSSSHSWRNYTVIPYFRDIIYPLPGVDRYKPQDSIGGKNQDRNVNRIYYDFIKKAVQNPDATGWRKVESETAQQLANAGRFVIGVRENHIVLVVPEDMAKSRRVTDGEGPWSRDAQHARESVRASRAGNEDQVTRLGYWGIKKVSWVVWDYEDLNQVRFDERQGKIVVGPRVLNSPPQRLRNDGAVSSEKRSSMLSRDETLLLRKLGEDAGKSTPPPPPGGGGIGGIDLTGTAEWASGPLPRLQAAVLDPATNTVILAGETDLAVQGLQGLSMGELAMCLWLVFGGPHPQDAQFSLDPADKTNPRGGWLKAVYRPKELRGAVGQQLFLADVLLKQLALNVILDSEGNLHERRSTVLGVNSPQTRSLGLANKGDCEPTIRANMGGFKPTLAANGLRFTANSSRIAP